MNTLPAEAKATAEAPYIYFKIDLTGRITVEPLGALLWLDGILSPIKRALVESGILTKQLPSQENEFKGSPMLEYVLVNKGQTIGLYQVNDWKHGVAILRAELGKMNLLECSQIGWHTSEQILRIVYPKPSEELLQPVLDTFKLWIAEYKSWSQSMLQFGNARMEKIPSKNPPLP